MSLLKQLYYSFSAILPTTLLQKVAKSPALFPYHHVVSDEELLHIKHLYSYKNQKQFIEDLDHLLRFYKPLSVEDLKDAVEKNRNIPSNSFLLTFDDGFREVYDLIAPILVSKGIPAIFFINPAFIDNKELFYRSKISLLIEQIHRNQSNITLLEGCKNVLTEITAVDASTIIAHLKKITNRTQYLTDDLAAIFEFSFTDYLVQKKPFLTTAQLIELNQKGFTIGAHSWDHPYYDLLSQEDQLLQTQRSIEFVKEKIQPSVATFSFPHFDNNIPQSFFAELAAATSVDLLFGIQNQKKELQNRMIHRFNAERPEMPMSKQLNGVLLLMMLRQLMGKNAVERK